MEKLTHQEETVMLHIWQLQECVIKDIVNAMLAPSLPYTTVASVVKNLEQKGYLQSRRYANVNVYRPLIEESVYKKHFLSGVVKDYFDNSYKELVTFFIDQQAISATELEEIIKLIEKGKAK